MKKQSTSQRTLIKTTEIAGGSLGHVDIPGGRETSESAGEWVRDSRRSKDRFFATARAIQQDNKDADPQGALANVMEAVEAVRRRS